MLLLSSQTLLICCEPNSPKNKKEIIPVLIKQQAGSAIYAFKIKARDWQTINNVERLANISIPAITDDIIKNGMLVTYLVQGNKQVVLPFNYYQVRRILSFQANYKTGSARVSIFGNFLMNVHEYYDFNIVVISPEMLGKYNCAKWNDYEEVKRVFKIKK